VVAVSDVLDSVFRYLPPKTARRAHYRGEPWWDWLEIEYHLSQPCAFDQHDMCRNVFVLKMPRMPTGYCECVCHAAATGQSPAG
jgi:hypothetical protein